MTRRTLLLAISASLCGASMLEAQVQMMNLHDWVGCVRACNCARVSLMISRTSIPRANNASAIKDR